MASVHPSRGSFELCRLPKPAPLCSWLFSPSWGRAAPRTVRTCGTARRAHLTRFMDEGALGRWRLLRIRGQQKCPQMWAFLLASNAKGTFIHEACQVRTAWQQLPAARAALRGLRLRSRLRHGMAARVGQHSRFLCTSHAKSTSFRTGICQMHGYDYNLHTKNGSSNPMLEGTTKGGSTSLVLSSRVPAPS